MELSSQTDSGKYYLYTESFWSGKKRLTVDGKETVKIGRKQFRCQKMKKSSITR